MESQFKSRNEFRQWLEQNHDRESELWLIYFKKHSGIESIRYNEAVEEALCFGWIDGKVKSIDHQTYMQRFSPRKPKSTWSKLNKERCLKMIAEGKMTTKGLELIEEAKKSGWWEKAYSTASDQVNIPEEFLTVLKKYPVASNFFFSLTNAQQKLYLNYLASAKQTETKIKRINKIIDRLQNKLKPGMM